MGACGSKVGWSTEGRDPMEELRRKGREIGYRDAAEPKELKGKGNINKTWTIKAGLKKSP